MKGADFVAVKRITSRKDRPGGGDVWTILAEPGESCVRVPESALSWLSESGDIVPRSKEPTPADNVRAADARRRTTKGEE
jgi:hypothetical protein